MRAVTLKLIYQEHKKLHNLYINCYQTSIKKFTVIVKKSFPGQLIVIKTGLGFKQTHHSNGVIDPTANTVFRRKRAILPKTALAQNEYSCDTFNKLILVSIDIIHRRSQNSLILLKMLKFHECASAF